MFHDPRLNLHTVKVSQQEHRAIAARHRLAKGTDEAARSATAPAQTRRSTRWLTRLQGPDRARLGSTGRVGPCVVGPDVATR
jgi:hypothetical protein